MNILDIYKKYNLPPNLVRHQVEVATIGQYVCKHWTGETVNSELITQALLLHDMGNIIKFTRPFLSEELRENALYWERVQDQFVKEYGADVHTATIRIVNELGLPDVSGLINDMRDVWSDPKLDGSWEERICEYADCCVTPKGIETFDARMEDLKKRYHFTEESAPIIAARKNGVFVEENLDGCSLQLNALDFSKELENLRRYEITVGS